MSLDVLLFLALFCIGAWLNVVVLADRRKIFPPKSLKSWSLVAGAVTTNGMLLWVGRGNPILMLFAWFPVLAGLVAVKLGSLFR